ncbi:hypothetical protein GJ697_01435 [Pseudoduganella sp. FT25W]|uniref:Uncharacterized protein n=1 Tax=Duganella alba TaxID=2666081 RepID=A0A6L5Q9K9_9BURK|nr:DUF5455 family protein [Duganella alba]MRX06494.1 hypothetical protein [Duganella alba]MRX14888.1 hypothetical protein [Duganella alba]
MPLLGNLIVTIITSLVAWLAKYLTQKTAVTIAIVAVISALLLALYAAVRVAMSSAIAGLGSVHPMFAAGLAMVISPATQQCITGYIAMWSLCELYKWKFTIMQLWSRTI